MRVEQQRWMESEVERLRPLEAIVRDLAAKSPWEGDVFPGCRYCDALRPAHESDCDWWAATQWVIAHDPAVVERNSHE